MTSSQLNAELATLFTKEAFLKRVEEARKGSS